MVPAEGAVEDAEGLRGRVAEEGDAHYGVCPIYIYIYIYIYIIIFIVIYIYIYNTHLSPSLP